MSSSGAEGLGRLGVALFWIAGVDEGLVLGSLGGRRVYRMRLRRAERMPCFR